MLGEGCKIKMNGHKIVEWTWFEKCLHMIAQCVVEINYCARSAIFLVYISAIQQKHQKQKESRDKTLELMAMVEEQNKTQQNIHLKRIPAT